MSSTYRMATTRGAYWVALVVMAGVIGATFSPVSKAQLSHATNAAEVNSVITALVEAHNQERAQAGLSPLKIAPKLTEAARLHAHDMARHEKLTHRGSNGTTPAQRVEQQGYLYRKTGENVAHGQPTPALVVQAWMQSPHHRRNILDHFTEIGAARIRSQDGTPYWCVVFGLPIATLNPAQAAGTLVTLVNRKRTDAGMLPLKVNAKLQKTAQVIAQAMAKKDTLQRQRGEDAVALLDRVKEAGYQARKISQDMAAGQSTPQAVVQSLMDNEGSQKGIFGDFADLGVSYATAKDGTPYWCLIFATPRPW
jgi:uncharacterized protein YkwD